MTSHSLLRSEPVNLFQKAACTGAVRRPRAATGTSEGRASRRTNGLSYVSRGSTRAQSPAPMAAVCSRVDPKFWVHTGHIRGQMCHVVHLTHAHHGGPRLLYTRKVSGFEADPPSGLYHKLLKHLFWQDADIICSFLKRRVFTSVTKRLPVESVDVRPRCSASNFFHHDNIGQKVCC
jgi:hypothetical protein